MWTGGTEVFLLYTQVCLKKVAPAFSYKTIVMPSSKAKFCHTCTLCPFIVSYFMPIYEMGSHVAVNPCFNKQYIFSKCL